MYAQDTRDKYDMGTMDAIFEFDNPRLIKKRIKQAMRKEWNRVDDWRRSAQANRLCVAYPRTKTTSYLAWHELPVEHPQGHN